MASSPRDAVVTQAGSRGNAAAANGAWVLAAAILGSSMAFIDGTVVNVALPALQSALHADLAGVQWVVESYALFLAALLLPGGSLGDRFGRRKVFVAGVLLFSVASMLCGLAASIGQLVGARAIQGVGGALLVPGSLAVISTNFPEEQRGRAIGIWSGFTSITSAIGPVLGGWFVEHASWRWVFFINVPIGIAVILISLWKVPESTQDGRQQAFDWQGGVLAVLGFGGIVLALIASKPLAGVLGGLALIGLVFWEMRAPSPMVPLGLFRSRNFSGANLLTLFLYFALSGLLFFFPMNLIQVQDYSATQAGAALLPFVLLMFVLSRWSGGLVDRYGARWPLVVGPVIVAAGFALFALNGIGGSYVRTLLPGVLVLGFGMAVSVAPLTTTVMNAVEESHAGTASGINNAVSRVAGLLAVAVFGVILAGVFQRSLSDRLTRFHVPEGERSAIESQHSRLAAVDTKDPKGKEAVREAFVAGYRLVMWISVGLAVASSMSAAVLIEDRKKRREGAKDSAQGDEQTAPRVDQRTD